MGYTTEFAGDLKFTCKMTDEMWERLESYFEEDAREHKEWNVPQDTYGPVFYYIDIEPNDDRSGIRWNGAEKCYGMVETVQFLTDEMRKEYPDFGLIGIMEAHGEEVGDHWFLIAEDGTVKSVTAEDYFVNYKNRISEKYRIASTSNIEFSIS